ncbi:MAG: DNA topoisomerase 4 subunit A [Anaerolineales bacterium]|nr:DNA topoisomerase 4 subunit A [Anaerolineales bacterium]
MKKTPGTVRKVDIDREVQQSYLDYAMSVIVARALPDARDGLKPVQRRILYAMNDMSLAPSGGYKKSARIVGEVLGKYHPHGDMAVYESMARMAQDFSMRYMLVDGQGNFGSVDGDPPAAMRYTEARLAPISVEILSDLEKDTVRYASNFDGSLQEPDVLPAAVPNLLVNGATGIAVGMATSIPPHNLGEVCDALVFMLRSWSRLEEISVGELTRHITGPDFPTGGLILDPAGSEEGLSAAYGSGRGRITVRARTHVEETTRGRSRILITELPYQVNKSALLERIADLVRTGAVEGISDLRDESDRRGMRVVIDLMRTSDARQVLRSLYKKTPMETTFSVNLLALVNNEPRMLTLKQALRVFLDHRLEVIRKRSAYDLERARERAHILEGLRTALKHLDEVIRLIRGARDADEARAKLRKRFRLSELQATAILDMPLRRLAALEREKIELEYKEKKALIVQLEKILASPKLLRQVLIDDLQRVKKQYADPRRSIIVRGWESEKEAPVTAEAAAPATESWVVLLRGGEISRIAGVKPPLSFAKRPPRFVLRAGSRDILYLFTEKGRSASIPVHTIPAREDPAGGVPFSTLCALEPPSRVIAGLAVTPADLQGAEDPRSILLATRKGMLKKTSGRELPGSSSQVLQAMKVAPEDTVGWALVLSGKDDILLATSAGRSIRFREEEIRPTGWGAAGVMGIRITRPDERVVAAAAPAGKEDLLLVSAGGQAKRTPVLQYPVQARYGVGVATWKSGAKTELLGGFSAAPQDKLALIWKDGQTRVVALEDIPRRGRPGAGKLILPRKTSGALEAVIPIRMKAPPVPKKAKPQKPKKGRRKPAKKTSPSRKKKRK